ncbi:MAG: chloride channel protein [Bdellovibrionales bacterium]|nr:chloride channel protein [Bdellovibrionales bacterium]
MKHQRGDFSRNNRILFLSAIASLVGIAAAFVAKGLLLLIALFTNIFYFGEFTSVSRAPSMEHWGVVFILVPVVGSLIIGLMARYGSEKIRGHGIPEALEAILFGKSIMQPKVALLKPLSSAISIGSGGPYGAEGPIIMTGGAVGSLTAQFLHVTSAERKTLLVAGAAAGMSAVFATPIAAVLLAIELLLFELKPRSVVPVAVASAFAALTRVHLLGEGPIFPVVAHAQFTDMALIACAGLGVLTGAFSTLLSNVLYKLEDGFLKLPVHWMWWPAIGGIIVGIGGYFQPRALGVGYDVIGDLLNGHLVMSTMLALFAVKAVIWVTSLASGTSGGVLAPLLIFGCSLGTLVAPVMPGEVTAGTWALIGMGAIMGGMMRSPFTAIFFCFELTKDTNVMLPLLIASVTAYAFTVLVMKRSILTEKVARRGYDVFREYSVDPLERCTVKDFYAELSDDSLKTSDPSAYEDETCATAADRMAKHDVGHLVVLDRDGQKILGKITVADLFRARQSQLEEESHRETMFPLSRA